jgi:hypothetical protein
VFFSRGFKLVRGMMDDLQAILVKHFYAKGHPRAAFTRYPGGIWAPVAFTSSDAQLFLS